MRAAARLPRPNWPDAGPRRKTGEIGFEVIGFCANRAWAPSSKESEAPRTAPAISIAWGGSGHERDIATVSCAISAWANCRQYRPFGSSTTDKG